jgi:hypothetical protein
MLPLPVEEQDRRLRAECPQFRLVAHAGWIGVWEGTVRPVCQTYRIRIIYFSRRYFPGWDLANPHLSVFVVDTPIGADPRGTGEKSQHVYRLGHPPDYPRLCICDPVDDDWHPSEYIVDRIIPWTIKWLFFHEDWVATGVWKGRGRHPELPEWLTQDDLDPESRARRERFRNAESHRLGRRIGVFASCPLMEAASVGCFPPPPWPRWNGLTPADVQSRIISILSPGPRRAAYSPSAWERDFPRQASLNSTSGADAKSSRLSPTTALAA